MTLLQTESLSVAYGRTEILHEVSLEVGEGEIVSLVGANGAGKSTLLRAVSGVLPPRHGRVLFRGEDVTRVTAERLVTLGLSHVPEGRQLFPSLTIEQNLVLGAYVKGGRGAALRRNLERNYAMFPVLEQRRTTRAGTLSGGQQQMLAIARGLMSEPRLLLLDEPSLGLAPIIVDQILEAVRTLRSTGVSVLLIEQNVVAALEISDRAYVMETGRIVMTGPSPVLASKDEVRKAYLGI